MPDEMKEPGAPQAEPVSDAASSHDEAASAAPAATNDHAAPDAQNEPETAPDPNLYQEDPYHSDPYESRSPEMYGSAHPGQALTSYEAPIAETAPAEPVPVSAPPAPPPPPPTDTEPEEEDEEEEGMLRMSFMEHLEELRTRILRSLYGIAVAFVVSIVMAPSLWRIVSAPAIEALRHLHYTPQLVAITPMEQFSIIYVKLPLLVSVFLGSPWVLYQVWSFISPGLYKRERRYAVPFILCTAGLFITGGVFAYFVAFRYGLEFLLGIGRDINVAPMVSINEYFDLFVNVTLGVGLVFEMPVLIFFLTLLRIASPRFLLKNSRYAVLAIVILASIVTPTPDVFNLMLFAVPMSLLFFIGVFASYILVLRREGKRFPWGMMLAVLGAVAAVTAGAIYLLMTHYHYHLIQKWPFLVK